VRKILITALLISASLLFATELMIGGGFIFGSITGWNLSGGLVDQNYKIDLGLDFDLGKTVPDSTTTKDFYQIDIFSVIPLYSLEDFKIGPALAIMSGNYASDSWETSFAIGIAAEYTYQSVSFSAGMLYPFSDTFDFYKALCVGAQFFITPPQGKQFIDKLFVSVDLLMGRVRFMAGLIEPF